MGVACLVFHFGSKMYSTEQRQSLDCRGWTYSEGGEDSFVHWEDDGEFWVLKKAEQ